jgi:preprotein translocase subunit SecE
LSFLQNAYPAQGNQIVNRRHAGAALPAKQSQVRRPVALTVEHRTPNPRAGGSNPSWPAIEKKFRKASGHQSLQRKKMASKKKTQQSKGVQDKKIRHGQDGQDIIFSCRIRQFIHEVQAEFKKVVWPDKKVTTGLTGFVLLLVIVISIYLGSVDLLLGKIVTMVLH